MAEVTANNVWFLVVALSFLPLTGKNVVYLTTSVSLDCKSQDSVYKLPVNRSINTRTGFYHDMLAVI